MSLLESKQNEDSSQIRIGRILDWGRCDGKVNEILLRMEQIELQAKLLNYFLGSNKSNIHQTLVSKCASNPDARQKAEMALPVLKVILRRSLHHSYMETQARTSLLKVLNESLSKGIVVMQTIFDLPISSFPINIIISRVKLKSPRKCDLPAETARPVHSEWPRPSVLRIA